MKNKRAGSEQLPIHFTGDVIHEMDRARRLFPGQEDMLDSYEWLSILTEEVGEVARGLNDRESDDHLYEELVQSAAMCARMALSIKNRDRG